MLKKIIKKWFCFPLFTLVLLYSFYLLSLLYVQPVELREDDKRNWTVKVTNDIVNIDCHYIGGNMETYQYTIRSGKGLRENWLSGTDLLLGSTPGVIIGNFDFDTDKEILLLGCEGMDNTIIKGLSKDIGKYYDNDLSTYVGFYDLDKGKFRFKKLKGLVYWVIIVRYYFNFMEKLFFVGLLVGITFVLWIFHIIAIIIIRIIRRTFFRKRDC